MEERIGSGEGGRRWRMTALKILRFVVSGGTATGANLGVAYILTNVFQVWYLFSTVIAFCVGITVSFFAQKLWTFEDRSWKEAHIQAGVFFLFTLWGLLLNTVIVYALVEYNLAHYLIAQFIAGIVIAIQNFFIYKLIFKKQT